MARTSPHRTNRRIRWWHALLAVAVLVVAAAGVVHVRRHIPRVPVPATPAMRAAAAHLHATKVLATHAPQPTSAPRTDRERLIAAAFAMRGIRYKWGGKTKAGLDCSGFTKAAYAAVGVRLPDGSFNQAKPEQALASISQLTPGDLLLYRWAGSVDAAHVTLYAGNGWAIGTGSPGQAPKVTVYPLADDLRIKGAVITFRHIVLSDEH